VSNLHSFGTDEEVPKDVSGSEARLVAKLSGMASLRMTMTAFCTDPSTLSCVSQRMGDSLLLDQAAIGVRHLWPRVFGQTCCRRPLTARLAENLSEHEL
jgi:hypothetical protein